MPSLLVGGLKLVSFAPLLTPGGGLASFSRLFAMNTSMLGWLNGWEILVLVLLVLLLFGAKKLPELARGLGQGIKEFKKSTKDDSDKA